MRDTGALGAEKAARAGASAAGGTALAVRRLRLWFRGVPLVPLLIICLVAIASLFAPLIAPHDPLGTNLAQKLTPPAWQAGGKAQFLLGTDYAGRDILSRIVWGARISLLVAALGLVVGATIGVTLGMLSGYFAGWVDGLIMRVTDIMLALPFILVAIVIVGIFGGGIVVVVVVVGLAGWSQYARIVRGEVLSLKQRDFIALARIAGCGDAQILVRHILPNITNTVIVLATLNVGSIILFESALSFLGMGVQPPTPAWGLMLAEGRPYISVAWWLVTFPGIALAATILGINFLGDWLRDRLDPKLRQM